MKNFPTIIIKFNFIITSILSFFLLLIFCVTALRGLIRLGNTELVVEWQADISNSLKIPFLLVFDWISLFFISTVSIISARVILYSGSYISQDINFSRFVGLVLSFILRIWILILSPNFIRILLGWDGLGVTSYLLVIYFQRAKSYSAGILTAITNRLGDVGLLLTIGLFAHHGSWSFFFISGLGSFPSFLATLLILTAATKRAQIPFSSWLPAAIAAPTPVSSLVHSSTLVTAGVYLLVRLNYLLASYTYLWCLTRLGLLTILIAGLSAIGELDIKKVIALSTLRQLGLIFFTLGLGLPTITFFHLVSHAYFKAILFICAGAIIHTFKDYQDLRALGGGVKRLPYSIRIFLVANLSLCGVPFLSGFFSKDLILEIILIRGINLLVFVLAILATALTVMYSVRLAFLIFSNTLNSESMFNLNEIDLTIKFRIVALLILSIVGGLGISWSLEVHRNIIFLPLWIKIFILLLVCVRPIVEKLIPHIGESLVLNFFHFIWFIPFIFSVNLSKAGLAGAKNIYSLRDSGWLWLSQVRLLKYGTNTIEAYSLFSLKSIFLKRLWIIIPLIMFI